MKVVALWLAAVPFAIAQPPQLQQPPLPPEQNAPQEPRFVEVPLLDCSGLPCIDMSTASGKTLRLLIDTADANAYLDTKAAQSLGSNLQGLKTDSDTDISQVQQTVVPGAKIGDLPMGDFPFMVLDTTSEPTSLNVKTAPFPADGALTFRSFQRRILQIDYPHQRVRVSEPLESNQPCPQICTDMSARHIGENGPVTLTTTGFFINEHPITVQLDTVFTGTVAVYPEAVKNLQLKKLAKNKHKQPFPYFQGGLQMIEADGATLGFQSTQFATGLPIYFFTSEEHSSGGHFEATVGSGLLKTGTAVFDFKDMKFWFENGTIAPSATPPSQ